MLVIVYANDTGAERAYRITTEDRERAFGWADEDVRREHGPGWVRDRWWEENNA